MSTTESPMHQTALAPWFGGKRTLAPVIVEELGKHSAYWEPFCGSMAVLMSKPESQHEHVNDLHCDLINLAQVVQHPTWGPKFYREMRRVLPSEVEFEVAQEMCSARWVPPSMGVTADHVARARQYFIASWLGRNGVAGTDACNTTFAVRWKPGGGHTSTRFQNAVASIPAWRRRLRRVVILNRDAFDVLDSIADVAGVAIYCDPPYLVKGSRYVHDFSDGFMGQSNDHERLAASLRRFKKARAVVSYYDDPALKSMYPGWTVRHCPMSKALVSESRRDAMNKTIAPEVLLINGPSLVGGAA